MLYIFVDYDRNDIRLERDNGVVIILNTDNADRDYELIKTLFENIDMGQEGEGIQLYKFEDGKRKGLPRLF